MADADVKDRDPHRFEHGLLLWRMHVGAIALKRCAELEVQNRGFRHDMEQYQGNWTTPCQ